MDFGVFDFGRPACSDRGQYSYGSSCCLGFRIRVVILPSWFRAV